MADEWAQIDDPIVALEAVLDEAGLTWEAYVASGQSGQLDPTIVDAAQRFQEEYFSVDLSAIGQTLSDHAKGECGIEIAP